MLCILSGPDGQEGNKRPVFTIQLNHRGNSGNSDFNKMQNIEYTVSPEAGGSVAEGITAVTKPDKPLQNSHTTGILTG